MLIRAFFVVTTMTACFTPDEAGNAFGGPKGSFENKLGKLSAAEVDTLYRSICRNLDHERAALGNEWKNASSKTKKDAVLDEARALLLSRLSDSLFVCWYGTGWDFNGTSTCPRQGNIACGYFVTTLLKHSGFLINRTHLAQVASSEMIKTFCPPEKIKIITNNQTKKLFDYIKSKPDGIFIVGLDNHTGFILKEGANIDFVHSNYDASVDKVVREPLEKSEIIKANGYFMVGDLSHSDATMEKWITGKKIE